MNKKLTLVRIGDIKLPKKVRWTQAQLDLRDEIINNYDPSIGVIKVSRDLRILDGNHRTTILKEAYGDDYKVLVRNTRIPFAIHMAAGIPLVIILLPFVICYRSIRYIFKKK